MVWGAISYHQRSNLHATSSLACLFVAYVLIEQMQNFVDGCLASDTRLASSKDDLWLRIQAICNSFPQADNQNLFDTVPNGIAGLITAPGGYTKY